MMKQSEGIKLAGRLVANAIRFRYLRATGRPSKITAASLEITHACIAKCVMCNIWRIPSHVTSLSVDRWLRILASRLFSDLRELDITGGEPFLVQELPQLLKGICDLIRHHLKSLRSIAITTNGLLTPQVLKVADAVLPSLKACNLELVMACAVDGIGPVHEQIRRVDGAWTKVRATLEGLIKRGANFPNLVLGLKTTILPVNVDELDKIADYAEANDLFTIMSPCIITRGRYLNPEKASALAFSPRHVEKMRRFYKSGRSLWCFHNDQMIRFLETGSVRKPCTCGFNYFFIRHDGTLFLCPLVDIPIGNVTQSKLEVLFSSRAAREVRHRIGRFPDCSKCTEPGLERFSLPLEGWAYLNVLTRMGPEAFFQQHRHMGLDKYLP